MCPSTPSANAPAPSSVLIFGSGESAMSMLAAGFADRASPEFAWAHCSGSTSGWDHHVLGVLEHGSEGRRPVSVGPADLHVSEASSRAIAQLIRPGGDPGRFGERLEEFSRLPPLLQRLVPAFPAPGPVFPIVLTNLDAARSPAVDATFSNPRFHDALRQERIVLAVTYRGEPASPVKDAFDRVLRVEGAAPSPWPEARVMSERGFEDTELLLPQLVRVAWRILALNPTFLRNGHSD